MKEQELLFSIESVLDIHPLENFKILFDNLKAEHLDSAYVTGRKPFSHKSLLKAIIFKNLTGLPSLTDLSIALKNNPSAAIRCGFNILKPLPSVERFSEFLRDKNNNALQKIRIQLVHELISMGLIRGNYLSIDSCPLPAKVKENNLKTNVKDRFNKERICKGDPDARLGIMVTFSKSKKEISYFWGYRNHVVIDAKEELPVWEIIKPANVQDSVMFIPLFDLIQKEFHFDTYAVMADGIYDSASILNYIIDTLKAKPRITRNPRNTKDPPERKFSKAGNPFCDAQLEMLARGTFYDKVQNRWRSKWVCPIHHSKKIAQKFFVCPVFHPKFFTQKGCYAYIRVDDDIRNQIDYGSESFKKDFSMRTGSERVFSRLLSICMQNPPVIGLKATANYVTIAHITVLLVALTAAKSNSRDKVRFIKSFLPNFNP
ncbi:MAG: transposase [Deltaproteobacteria bacterium]|nr:transposase [Deltaproteobacteria bacterium]